MCLKLFVESLQNSVGDGSVVIAKDVLQLVLSLVGALVFVVGDQFLKLRIGRERMILW